MRVAQESNPSSKSFDSYLNQERKLSRQLSDPLKSVKKSGVSSGTLSPIISRQSSKCRPLVISSSTLCSSSPSHVDSGSETEAGNTETESDEQSTIVNTDTLDSPVLSTSSTTLNLMSLELKASWSSNSISDEDCDQSKSDNSLTDISFFVSLDHLPSSVYESVMTSFDVEGASKASSPTFLTASLSSTFTSPQCSFHSCSSSPPSSPIIEAASKPQWRKTKMVKSDSVHEEAVITTNQFREKSEESSSSSTGCRRALSCPSAKSRRSRQSFINQKHQESGKKCVFDF